MKLNKKQKVLEYTNVNEDGDEKKKNQKGTWKCDMREVEEV